MNIFRRPFFHMNIGLDIGEYKTVVGNSQSNGSIVFDELSFRSIKSMVELTIPRRVGNHVGEPMYMTIDKRFHSFTRSYNTAHYTFLKYLVSLGKGCTSITVTVPVYADTKERERLADFFMSMGIRVHVITDLAAAGFLYGIKHEKAKSLEKYALIDLGHSKTTFGVFAREKNQIKVIYMKCVQIGGRDIDQCLIDFLMKKHNLDDKVIAEKLRLKIEKVKSNLNEIPECKFSIDVKGESMSFDLTREEYKVCIQEIIPQFSEAFDCMRRESNWMDSVQAIGGNRFNSFINELLKDWSLSIEMNAGESVAVGAALSGAVCRFGSNLGLSLYDIVMDDITIRIVDDENEEGKSVVGIQSGDVIPSTLYKLNLKNKNNFIAVFLVKDKVIKTVSITEITGDVELRFGFNSLGRLLIETTNCVASQSNFTFDDIVAEEKEMIEAEEAISKVGEMRNELEGAFSSLSIDKFPEEQQNLLNEARRDILFASMSETIDEELQFRDAIYKKIQFLEETTSNLLSEGKAKIDNRIKTSEDFINENKDLFVPSIYKLQGLIYKSRKIFDGITCDVFGMVKLNEVDYESVIKEFDNLLRIAMTEIIRKKEEEKRKKEEEEKRKENEMEKEEEEKEKKDDKNGEEKEKIDGKNGEEKEKMDEESGEEKEKMDDKNGEDKKETKKEKERGNKKKTSNATKS